MELLTATWRFFFFFFFYLSFIKRILSLAFNKVLLFIMFIDHPEIIRASRTMKLCGSCSSYQGHVQRIPALSFTESLRITRYSNIAVPKPLELSNYCWVINTADCSSSWTPWTIKTYFFFKLFFFVSESKRYTYLLAFTKKNSLKKKGYVGSTVCWSIVW